MADTPKTKIRPAGSKPRRRPMSDGDFNPSPWGQREGRNGPPRKRTAWSDAARAKREHSFESESSEISPARRYDHLRGEEERVLRPPRAFKRDSFDRKDGPNDSGERRQTRFSRDERGEQRGFGRSRDGFDSPKRRFERDDRFEGRSGAGPRSESRPSYRSDSRQGPRPDSRPSFGRRDARDQSRSNSGSDDRGPRPFARDGFRGGAPRPGRKPDGDRPRFGSERPRSQKNDRPRFGREERPFNRSFRPASDERERRPLSPARPVSDRAPRIRPRGDNDVITPLSAKNGTPKRVNPIEREADSVLAVIDDSPVRLSKVMTEQGLCSRREADDLIARGLVSVDGAIVSTLGTKVPRNSKVELLPRAKELLQNRFTILLNKPIGYVSGQPEDDYEPAVRLVTRENQIFEEGEPPLLKAHLEGLAPAGRLDIDSQGLLVFTQNGTVAKLLIGEDSLIEKEYIVRVEGELSDEGLQLLNHGLELDGVPLKEAKVEWLNQDQLRFVLREGKKRQIRRMCEAVGLRVTGLKRVRVGKVMLGNLPEGKWRFLRPDESF